VPNAWLEQPVSAASLDRLDRLNAAIAEDIQRSGLALVMTTRIHGRVALRMSICSHRTLERDIDATFEALAGIGRGLVAEAALEARSPEPISVPS
jgi:glutamate/tyrosine decarboxylase-like PLP-dependent enzyme